jgi:hypothetical protein
VKKESSSFLKKRTKKLLQVWPRSIRTGRSSNNQKFFASFFKKEVLAFGLPNSPNCPRPEPAAG